MDKTPVLYKDDFIKCPYCKKHMIIKLTKGNQGVRLTLECTNQIMCAYGNNLGYVDMVYVVSSKSNMKYEI